MMQITKPRLSESGKTVARSVTLTPDDLAYLLKLDGNLSRAIRRVVRERREDERRTNGR